MAVKQNKEKRNQSAAASRRRQKPRPRSVVLENPLTNEQFACIIVDEETIEGVLFLVADLNGRRLKLNKAAYTIVYGK